MQDRFQGRHQTTNGAAVAAFERAVGALAAHRPDVGPALAEAIALEPDFTSAHALQGLAAVILGRAELLAGARVALQRARSTLQRSRSSTQAEAALVSSLDRALVGRFLDGATILEDQLAEEPVNFLLLKLAYALRFMAGDGAGMLRATELVLPAWSPDAGGFGYVQGCHAFAAEEAGQYRAAERHAEVALEYAPDDAWALHAISHVHEMQGRLHEGIDRLETTRGLWTRCNNFRFHMAWHLALLHLEAGSPEKALAIYDLEIRPEPTEDYRDVANASSMLWRLKLAGIGVGHRWDELRAIAARRAGETTLMFASLHNLLSLVAYGDRELARASLAHWGASAVFDGGDQARVALWVGLDLGSVIVDGVKDHDLVEIASRLPSLGGSHAQRDVFVQTLVEAAREAGDVTAMAAILDMRRVLRQTDSFALRYSHLPGREAA